MFSVACQKASGFTRPLIVSTRTADGVVSSGCGAFVVLNEEGWFLTAGHLFDSFVRFQEEQKRAKAAESVKEIGGAAGRIVPPDRSGRMPDPKTDPKRILNHSFWWGSDVVRLESVYINREIDIAVGKLGGFKPEWVSNYPVIKNPGNMRPGTSLCRLGYPFIQVGADFDDKTNAFRLKEGTLPMPLFPNDGIHTRNVDKGKSKDGNYDMLYVEVSTPGLRGQSGGPIYDKNALLCGIQVGTTHLPLGFHPEAEFNGMKVVENQFLNVGIGVHCKTLVQVLESKGVSFRRE